MFHQVNRIGLLGFSTIVERIMGQNHKARYFTILDNYDWWKDVTLLDFLSKVGRFVEIM